MIKYSDKELIYEIRLIILKIKNLTNQKSLKNLEKDSEIAKLLDFNLLHISDLVIHLSDELKEKYSISKLKFLVDLGKAIKYNEINIKSIMEVARSKEYTDFEILIDHIIKKEQYDFTDLDRIEKMKKKYGLANSYNETDPFISNEQSLKELAIQEINKINSRKYGRFKIRTVSYGSKEKDDEEYSITEFLSIRKDGEWVDVLYTTIEEREFDCEHGKVREHSGYSFQKILYVDVEDLVYYIENDFGTLYCSIDKIGWYKYNVALEKRPYHKRIEKLRKIKLPN
ncbi:MAG: hypothetical protein FK733_06040 [Asgard group archaeon]|nr:hypothetical protein [Asgard group archaeon]